ncbi:hypothetical protein GCM10010343_14290 [Streptomyces avidinii]|uniref:Uncharacterized protein n=1 Tax=Streptomyces avidinii TaxID=1895 RepID=A0ABS4KY31_STRAV|nr:hypothetical protein [Streptomyces avidinii]MBP2034949.1 hypothetical protein [Streptomyces avidinii]GGY90036.1 hypothetical protein GCM10010343_14290 [Streptomyces avidinii]
MAALSEHGVSGKTIRIADHDVRPGVKTDMGGRDAWPEIQAPILGCDILTLSIGHPPAPPSALRERLDA